MSDVTRNTVTVVKILFARLRFVAIFVVAGLVVGYWDNIRNHIDKWTRPPVAPDALAAESNIEFYCPMHPQVVRSEAGKCPICSMELVKREKGKAQQLPADVLARVQLSPQRVALANIHTTAVELRPLVRRIGALGVLDYNETKVAQISARVAGRADELFVSYTGQPVKKGDAVYSLYSPEVFTAQREYLLARQRVKELPGDATADTRSDAAAVYNASMQKLVLWGIAQEQLEKLDGEYDRTGKVPTHLSVTSPISGTVIRKEINPGGYLQVGESPYTVADLTSLWLKAKVYESDIPFVHVGDEAQVNVDALAGTPFKGTVTYLSYQLDPDTRTLDARIEVSNADLRLRPGMFATASIAAPVTAGNGAATAPATQPAAVEAPVQRAKVFQSALQPYLSAQKLLAADKSEGVSELLHQCVEKLRPLADDPEIKEDYRQLTEAVHRTSGQEMEPLRKTFKGVSVAMIAIGKATGVTAEGPAIDILRCPMTDKPNWLQEAGDTANPYYGSKMLNCGAPIGTLPRVAPDAAPTTRPAGAAGKVLAVPRSAVIDTGKNKVVYVQSSDGVFDMRAVQLGPAAGEYYPVYGGLEEGDRVVTVGGFLLDAENRLNPGR